MKDNLVQRVLAAFVLMLAILGVVAGVAVSNLRRATVTSDWVNHTHAVILEADAIQASLHAGDAALRSYLVTGDERDHTAFREAYSEMVEHLEVAKALTRQETNEHRVFVQLEPVLARHVDSARGAVKTRQQEGPGAVAGILKADTGETLSQVSRGLARLKDDEKTLLVQRDKASYLQAQVTRWTVLAGVGLNFVLLALMAWIIRDDIATRRKAATALEEANAQLEAKVQERTAELAESNRALKAENLERQWSNQAVEHQLRYSQLIINSISDLILVVTRSLNISRINPAVVHLTGLPSKDLVSLPLARVVHLVPNAADAAPNLEIIGQALTEGHELQELPAIVVAADNRTVPVRLNLVPLRDRDKLVGGVVTLRRVQAQPGAAPSPGPLPPTIS